MATSNDNIKFFPTNMLSTDFNVWVKVDCTVEVGQITIAPGGSMTYDITDIKKITASRYCKLVVTATGKINDINNYKSGTDIILKEVYTVDDINKIRTRNVGITPFSAKLTDGKYVDSTILNMKNTDMSELKIQVINNTDEDLVIYTIGLYRSQDLDASQQADSQSQVIGLIGTKVEPRTDDPVDPELGRIWMRTDL